MVDWLSARGKKLDLVTEKFIGFETPHRTAIQYNLGADGNRSTQISLYKNANRSAYVYTYDANGNITSIKLGSSTISYRYDALDQMVREDNPYTGKTVLYDYDLGGNLLAKHYYAYTTADDPGEELDTVTYGYDGTWKDLLTSYDGEAITYDTIGNPLTYRGRTLTWEGRRLKSLTGTDISGSYLYNLDGLRTKKTVNGDIYTYHYNGELLMMQEVMRADGSRSVQRYSYDPDGNVVSVNYDGADYYYLRNAQNDIVEILDSTGASKVLYQYDSWGKLLKIQGSGAYTIGRDNPFRYRGYYYDTETGLYYLQSRYYDPEVGRFINADSQLNSCVGVLGYNLFSYCESNPVNNLDKTGHMAAELTMAASLSWNPMGLVIACVAIAAGAVGANYYKTRTKEKVADAVKEYVETKKSETEYKDQSVYVLRDPKDGNRVKYVGRTKSPKRREKEHKRNPIKKDYKMHVKITGLIVSEARAWEQALISTYTLKYLNNARREIAVNNLSGYRSDVGAIVQIFYSVTEDELMNLMER